MKIGGCIYFSWQFWVPYCREISPIVAAPPTDLLGKLQNFYHFTCGKGWRSPTKRGKKTGDIEMFHGNNMIEREHI
jgi:hypothetical protein